MYTVIDMRGLFLVLLVLGCVNAVIPASEMTVNGTIFRDLNENEIWDPGEEGLSGLTVVISDVHGSQIDSTDSVLNGYYQIDFSCSDGDELWIEPELPITVEFTGDEERYAFHCTNASTVSWTFGVKILTCEDNEDCSDKRWCSEGLCLPLDCPEGYIAVYHECIPEPECYNNDDCADDETCSAGECEALFCVGLEDYVIEGHKCISICLNDTDCADDELCSMGDCVKVSCPEDYIVEEHRCVYVVPEIPEEEPEEVPEENVTEEEPEEIKENVTEEVPEEEPPAEEPEEQPEEEKPPPVVVEEEVEEKASSELVLIILILAIAAVVIAYMVLYRKQT